MGSDIGSDIKCPFPDVNLFRICMYLRFPQRMSSPQAQVKCKKCRNSIFKESETLRVFECECQDSTPNVLYFKFDSLQNCLNALNTSRPRASNGADVEGKLYCGHCDSKLGSFDLCGSKCACNKWIAPSFAFQVSKLDLAPIIAARNEE